MSTTILKSTDFDAKRIEFAQFKKNKRGGGIVYMKYDNPKAGKHNVFLQTPKMYCPFGASAFKKEDLKDGEVPKYSLQLSFRGHEDNKPVDDLKEKLESFDNMIVEEVLKNKELQANLGLSNKKNLSKDTISVLHSPMVRYPAKPEYAATLNVKLPVVYGTDTFQTDLYGKDKTKIELTYENIEDVLPARCEVRALLQITAVWIIGNKFGISVRASQLVVYPSETLSGYSFLDSSDVEDEDENVLSSDDESEQSEEEEEESDKEEVVV